MPFVYKGVQRSYLEGEAYNDLYRSGFAREHRSKAAALATLNNVNLPLDTEVAVEKIYRIKRGYEPNAPFRGGEVAEYWRYRLKQARTWYDPKTGKPSPNKWKLIDHGVRKHGGHTPFTAKEEAGARMRADDSTAQKIFKWLRDHDISTTDVHVYTQDEWRAREEPYGNDAAYTITMEGELNHIMNYPTGPRDVRLSQEFVKFLSSIGFHYEMGFAWSMHLYPEERAPIPGRERDVAQQANKTSEMFRPWRGRHRPPALWKQSPRKDLEEWLAWADPNRLIVDWEDPAVSDAELWGAIDRAVFLVEWEERSLPLEDTGLGLEEWNLGYDDNLNAFAAVRYPKRPGRFLIIVMTGEEGETPERPDEEVDVTLYEWDEEAGEWDPLIGDTFKSPAEAARSVATNPVWLIA